MNSDSVIDPVIEKFINMNKKINIHKYRKDFQSVFPKILTF